MTVRLTVDDRFIKIGYMLISECYEKSFPKLFKEVLKIINTAFQRMLFSGQIRSQKVELGS
jgi:hypothetical protein